MSTCQHCNARISDIEPCCADHAAVATNLFDAVEFAPVCPPIYLVAAGQWVRIQGALYSVCVRDSAVHTASNGREQYIRLVGTSTRYLTRWSTPCELFGQCD